MKQLYALSHTNKIYSFNMGMDSNSIHILFKFNIFLNIIRKKLIVDSEFFCIEAFKTFEDDLLPLSQWNFYFIKTS